MTKTQNLINFRKVFYIKSLVVAIIIAGIFIVPGFIVFAHPGHEHLPSPSLDGLGGLNVDIEVGGSHVSDVDELQKLIEERSAEIEEIERERARLESELGQVSATADALTREVSSLNHQINDLELSMRTNELVIDRLALELAALDHDIDVAEQDMERSKQTVARLLVQMQQRENENLLTLLLKNQTLSEGFSEIQSIISLNQALTGNINELLSLREELEQKIIEADQNKTSTEIEQNTLTFRRSSIDDLRSDREVLLSQTQSEAQEYEQRIAELEDQQQELYRIIAEMEEALRLAFDPTLLPSEMPGIIGWPLADTCVTQPYGETAFARTAYRTGYHNGVDFRARVPTPVFSIEDGVVIAVDNNDRSSWQKYQYGKYVLVEHDNNLTSIYAHLSSQAVQVGQRVTRGQMVGYTGNTGFSTAPHLHFGVYWSPSVELRSIPPAAGLVPIGVDIDPTPYLPTGSNGVSCYI